MKNCPKLFILGNQLSPTIMTKSSMAKNKNKNKNNQTNKHKVTCLGLLETFRRCLVLWQGPKKTMKFCFGGQFCLFWFLKIKIQKYHVM